MKVPMKPTIHHYSILTFCYNRETEYTTVWSVKIFLGQQCTWGASAISTGLLPEEMLEYYGDFDV